MLVQQVKVFNDTYDRFATTNQRNSEVLDFINNKLKLEVDIRGTDGLIEVTDHRAMVLSERIANGVFDNHINNAFGSIAKPRE